MGRKFILATALALPGLLFDVAGAAAVEWITRTDLTSKDDQQLVTTLPANGFVPIFSKASVTSDGQLRYDVVYLKPLTVAWEYRSYNEADFQRRNRDLQGQGYSLISHHTYTYQGVLHHNCIWHK
jgi:Bacterial tandem repeat domain 1